MSDISTPAAVTLDDCWNRIGVWSAQGASCPRLTECIHCRNCDHYARSGRQILERALPEDYRRQWTQRLAEPRRTEDAHSRAVMLFRLGDEWLALDSRCVSEITPVLKIHCIPHRSDELVKGLVNIRGELRLCVSIGTALQLDKASESHFVDHEILERMVLIENPEHSFVFPVSEVEGIVRYRESDLQALPATLANARSKLTTGIVGMDDRQVGILDHELLFFALAKGLS